MLICHRCFRNGPDICHALDLTTCTSLKTLKFIFSADSEEVSSFRDMEHLWLESCISASTYLLVTHRHTLRALRVVRFVMDVDGAGSLVGCHLGYSLDGVHTPADTVDLPPNRSNVFLE